MKTTILQFNSDLILIMRDSQFRQKFTLYDMTDVVYFSVFLYQQFKRNIWLKQSKDNERLFGRIL